MGINFDEERTLNAKVKFSWLGLKEDGNLAVQIGFDCEGNKGICTSKIPCDHNLIKNIIDTLEIRSWEDLPKKYARIKIKYGELETAKVVAIGNVIEERWVRL